MTVQRLDERTYDEVVAGAEVPVLVDVTAEWCAPCKAMEPVLAELAAESAGRLLVVSVDVDESPDVVRRLGVMSFPTLLVLDGGVERARLVGARGLGRLREDLHRAVPGLTGVADRGTAPAR